MSGMNGIKLNDGNDWYTVAIMNGSDWRNEWMNQ